jgi:AP endonuclease-1
MSHKRSRPEGPETGESDHHAVKTAESILKGTIPFVRHTNDGDFDPLKMWKILTWNVDGLHTLIRGHEKEFMNLMREEAPDVLCMQDTKLYEGEGETIGKVPDYIHYDSCNIVTKGHAGTRVYVKNGIPHEVSYGLDLRDHDGEGRVIVVSLPTFSVINTYVPNSGIKLERLSERVNDWDKKMEACLRHVSDSTKKPIIWTGDLNVAERDYDRYFNDELGWNSMQECPGFTPEERTSFRRILARMNMVDGFRHLYPNSSQVYSFWSNRIHARDKNAGWRLSYFILSEPLVRWLIDSFMLPEYATTNHCPCVAWLHK